MKREFKFRSYHYLLMLTMMMFVGMGATFAQAGQGNAKMQRFTQCDRNGDGFISTSECRNLGFANFDKDGDGLLNRNEYRNLKSQQNRNQMANRQGNRSGRGQAAKRGAGNGNGQRLRNNSGNGTPQRLRDGSCGNKPANTGNRAGYGRGRRG